MTFIYKPTFVPPSCGSRSSEANRQQAKTDLLNRAAMPAPPTGDPITRGPAVHPTENIFGVVTAKITNNESPAAIKFQVWKNGAWFPAAAPHYSIDWRDLTLVFAGCDTTIVTDFATEKPAVNSIGQLRVSQKYENALPPSLKPLPMSPKWPDAAGEDGDYSPRRANIEALVLEVAIGSGENTREVRLTLGEHVVAESVVWRHRNAARAVALELTEAGAEVVKLDTTAGSKVVAFLVAVFARLSVYTRPLRTGLPGFFTGEEIAMEVTGKPLIELTDAEVSKWDETEIAALGVPESLVMLTQTGLRKVADDADIDSWSDHESQRVPDIEHTRRSNAVRRAIADIQAMHRVAGVAAAMTSPDELAEQRLESLDRCARDLLDGLAFATRDRAQGEVILALLGAAIGR